MKLIKKLIDKINTILYYSSFNDQQKDVIKIASEEYGLSDEQIKKYAYPKFTGGQLDEIFLGVSHGLTDEQIDVYISSFRAGNGLKYFNASQMEQIRLGFEQGLSIEQVKKYAMDFSPLQMEQIRLGFVHGLTTQQVEVYRSYYFTNTQMKIIRLKLEEGVTINEVIKMTRNIWEGYN